MGRLLLEREEWKREATHGRQRTNCCASLPADDMVLRDRSNCCVSVVPILSSEAQERRHKMALGFVFAVVLLGCLFAFLIVGSEWEKDRRP